jgi:hypothetical protein
MQIVSTHANIPPPPSPKSSREQLRTGVPQVEPVDEDPLHDPPREEVAARAEKPEKPDTPKVEAESYRLNFDEEKRRLYLELLNPVTGDVIQRVPRDDLAFAFAAGEDAPPQGIRLSV